ncbi:hypothetical protein Astex_2210 [Asticcacaulis excentricus CB 48]|uniref:Uncharacterized protein n=1 Tax=Asticcacaulis excentricus (strain ATCC 15261 / DSM 4724 / KCTC 12464 / NCIMB 9791 / VKM B-1370 / CB 48) TaxID=573065 RepID=E8RMB5_ASTEC|nr:hypothetical protein Astex_2210 [Asticcacaulis excentricus CB 48]
MGILTPATGRAKGFSEIVVANYERFVSPLIAFDSSLNF